MIKSQINLILSEQNEGTGWSELANQCINHNKNFKNYIMSRNGLYLISNKKNEKDESKFILITKFIRFSKSNISGTKFNEIISLLKIFILVITLKPNTIIVVPEPLAWPTYFLNKFFNIPTCYFLAGTYSSIFVKKKIRCINSNDLFAFISKYTLESSGINTKLNRSKIINPGIDKKKWFHEESEFDQIILKSLKGKDYIVFAGRNLKVRKGFEFIYNTFLYLEKNGFINQNIYLVIPGIFSEKTIKKVQKIKAVFKFLKIIIPGFISQRDMRILYSNSILNLLPAKPSLINYEGYGLVHLEAGACGTPTVGCYESGNEDACNFKGSYLVNYGKTKELASLILKAIKSDLQIPNIKDIRSDNKFKSDLDKYFFKLNR